MTSGARPTWNPALGGRSIRDTASHPIAHFHVQDLASYTTLKLRQPGQNNVEDLRKKNLREELRKAELEHLKKQGKTINNDKEDDIRLIHDGNDSIKDDDYEEQKRLALENSKALDKSDTESSEEDTDTDSDSGSDDEDDEAELLRELEKIRKERAEEKAREEQKRIEEEEKIREEEIASGNPLIADGSSTFGVKRRWDDDVVFKNQARGVEDKPKKRFVNDLLRSDFHKKFINKYIQ